MPRPKKPDPPTQKLTLTLDKKVMCLLNDRADNAYWNDGTGNHTFGDFNRLAKADQNELLSKLVSEMVVKDYISRYGQEAFDRTLGDYQKDQAKKVEYWSMEHK